MLRFVDLYTTDFKCASCFMKSKPFSFENGKVHAACLCLATAWYGNTLAFAPVSVSPLWLIMSITVILCRTLQWQQSQSCVRRCALIMHQRLRGQQHWPPLRGFTLLSVTSVNKRSLAKFRERLGGLIHSFWIKISSNQRGIMIYHQKMKNTKTALSR